MPVNFADLGVPADLVAVLSRQGIEQPFPIQAATLPEALSGHDISGRAPTGSGKTLAFGLPVVAAMAGARSKPRRPRALILVPTRELATQVQLALEPLLAVTGSRITSVFGGTGYQGQRKAFRQGVDIVVGCPGRLEDLMEQGDVALSDVSVVVVDEADRMADMGFLPAVRRLLDATKPDRQTLLFSATLDGEVDVLVRRYQRDPRRHEVVEDRSTWGEVRHLFWRVDNEQRLALTSEIAAGHSPVMVFCRTRHGADRLTKRLDASGVRAAAIHGARTQPQRESALAAFKSGYIQALVATDVAARGIHVDDVACVVHFDPPADAKDYIHRSGRTGRAGDDGTVISLVARDQVKAVRSIQKALGVPTALDEPDTASLPVTEPVRRAPAPRPSTPRPSPPHPSTSRPSSTSRVTPSKPYGGRNAGAGRATSTGRGTGGGWPGSAGRNGRTAERTGPARGATTASPRRDEGGFKAGPQTGQVKWFNVSKGYGFIAPHGGGRDLLVRQADLRGQRSLGEGDVVAYEARDGQRGPVAANVRSA